MSKMKTEKKEIDFFEFYTPTDFDSPEVIEEMKQIQAEIERVMEGAKIDPAKMATIFNMKIAARDFCQTAFPKVGFWTFPTKLDIFRAGIIYGIMASKNSNNKEL